MQRRSELPSIGLAWSVLFGNQAPLGPYGFAHCGSRAQIPAHRELLLLDAMTRLICLSSINLVLPQLVSRDTTCVLRINSMVRHITGAVGTLVAFS